MTDTPINGASAGPRQADAATQLLGYKSALDAAEAALGAAGGAVGLVAFTLYPDGSVAVSLRGKQTPGLYRCAHEVGLNNLIAMYERALQNNAQQQAAVKAFALKHGRQ